MPWHRPALSKKTSVDKSETGFQHLRLVIPGCDATSRTLFEPALTAVPEVQEIVSSFSRPYGCVHVEVRRIALNKPPQPNPRRTGCGGAATGIIAF